MKRIFLTFVHMLLNSVVLGFSDVFTTNGTDNFDSGRVEIYVNGSSKGSINVGSKTLGGVIQEQAKYYGLKSFTVYVDGVQTKTEHAAVSQQCKARKIELVAKDARGWKRDTPEEFIWTVSDADPSQQAC